MKKVVVVDDDQLILFGIAKAFRHRGLEVETYSNGKEALSSLSERPCDLCLLDIHLGDANGVEIMETVRQKWPEMPIILMTAGVLKEQEHQRIDKAVDSGKCHFIVKPFDLSNLMGLAMGALEEQLGTECWNFAESRASRREYCRKPYVTALKVYLDSFTETGKRLESFHAISTDISDGGIGLLTSIPLQVSQVVGFDDSLARRSGVVAWSKSLDENTWRAGIRFS